MKYLEQFPTAAMFLTFFVMSCLFAYCGTVLKIVLMCLTLLFLLFVIFASSTVGHDLRFGLILTLSACLTAGILSLIFFDVIADGYEKHNAETDNVTLRIVDCDYALSYTARYEAVVTRSELIPKGTRLLIETDMTYLENGTELSGEVTYTSLAESGTDSFDSVQYYLPKRIMIMAEDVSLSISGKTKMFSLSGLFEQLNDELTSNITSFVRYDAAGMASAVLLGSKDELTESVSRDFRRLGISHLLVVSGTHFSVIITFAESTMRKLKVNRRVRAVFNMVLIVFLMYLTGFTASVVRAGIMHFLAQLSLVVSRKANTINSFAISGTLIILANPYSAMDCGLQLSFIATYSCIFFLQNRGDVVRYLKKLGYRRGSKMLRALSFCIETIMMTSLVTLNTLPIMWLYFGEISLISIPINVVFIPLVTGLMYITGLYLLLFPLRLFIFPMAAVLEWYCLMLSKLAAFFSQFDWIMLPVNYDFSVIFLIPLSALLVILPFAHKKWRKRLLASACGVCVLFFCVIGIVNVWDRGNIYFSYLPEKKNDGFVLKSDGKVLICEMSDASFGYSYNLTDEASDLHCCEIETLLLTHYHNKHIQLLERLCQREIVRSIVLPEPTASKNVNEYSIYEALCSTAEQYGLEVTTVPVGGSFTFGDTEITLFERVYVSRSSHPITALEINMRGNSAVIASCSFNQSVSEITEALEAAEFPILGRHSPVYKKAIDLSFDEPMAVVISDQAYEWLSDEAIAEMSEENIIIQPEEFRVKINRGNEVSTQTESTEIS